jgi:hypothetical protein
MNNLSSTKFYEIDISVIEDYNEIKFKLKDYFITMGESFKWKLIESYDTVLIFNTKFDWFWGLQETVKIDFSRRNIEIKSHDDGKSPYDEKVRTRNIKNCESVISSIPEIILKYNSSDYEINRISMKKKIEQELIDKENKIRQMLIDKENIRLGILEEKQSEILQNFDVDNDGNVDLIDIDSFNKLLNKNQKIIIEIDKSYIQKFVKISLYFKTKKSNIQELFKSIRKIKFENELEELSNLLKNQIYTYELLGFHSINMITSLVESDLITFYEIYECFDQLGVFNSNWENEVSSKLQNINYSVDQVNQSILDLNDNLTNNLQDIMYSIYQMENNIVNSVDNLTYTTQDSFRDLSVSVEKQLSSIDSSIKFNNLLTGIQTYQMYKINKNIKKINYE